LLLALRLLADTAQLSLLKAGSEQLGLPSSELSVLSPAHYLQKPADSLAVSFPSAQ
jgi:hypothetical protein